MAVVVLIILSGLIFASVRFLNKRKTTLKQIHKQEPILGVDVTYHEVKEPRLHKLDEVVKSKSATNIDTSEEPKIALLPNTIILQIRAAQGKRFMGYELLQTLLTNGLSFGEMNIFHCYESPHAKGPTLFSIAAATPKGTFEINNMGAFSCIGLVVFMRIKEDRQQLNAFDLMLDTAKQLADDLGGEIFDAQQQPLTLSTIESLRQRICALAEKQQYSNDLVDEIT
jgi:cell division protein ZipA